MSSFADRHNKKSFDVPFDTSEFEFFKPRELDDKIHRVYGYFSSVGMYGKQYSLILSNCFLNLPKYMTDEMDKMTSEDDTQIRDGSVGIERADYISKNGKQCATIRWVDL